MIPQIFFLLAFFFSGSYGQSCQSLTFRSSAEKLTNICYSTVDYDYYLPAGLTEDNLRNMSNQALKDDSLKTFSTGCQEALAKYVCSTIYLRCQPGVDLTNLTTYNYEIYITDTRTTFPLPIQRPCQSVCTDIQTQCASDLYSLIQTPPDCTQTYDYSNGQSSSSITPFRFDSSNDQDTCFLPADLSIAESSEPYLNRNGGVCAGLVENLYAPGARGLNSNFSLLQEPYVVQNLIETTISSIISRLPPTLSETCALSLRKYICYSSYLTPQDLIFEEVLIENSLEALISQLQSSRTGLLMSTITLPSYPHVSICQEFASNCAALVARSSNPALQANCSARVPGRSFRAFPEEEQVLTSASTPFGTLAFKTNANTEFYFNSTEYSYKTLCPSGFVVPDDPTHDDVRYVQGTGCAVACRANTFSEDEWETFNRFSRAVPVLNTILGFLLVFAICTNKDFLNEHLLLTYVGLSNVASTFSMVFYFRENMDERFCEDNAVNELQKNTISLCVIQGVIIMYCFLALCLTCLVITYDALFKLTWSTKKKGELDETKALFIQYFVILGLPMIPTFVALGKEYFGFNRTLPFCWILDDPYVPKNVDILFIGLPILIMTLLMMIGIFLLVIQLCRKRVKQNSYVEPEQAQNEQKDDENQKIPDEFSSIANQDQENCENNIPESQEEQSYNSIPTCIFLILTCTMWIGYTLRTASFYFSRDDFRASYREFVICIYGNFDGTDESWESVCGENPSNRSSPGLNIFLLFCLNCHTIFLCFPYFISLFTRVLIQRFYEEKKVDNQLNDKPKFNLIKK